MRYRLRRAILMALGVLAYGASTARSAEVWRVVEGDTTLSFDEDKLRRAGILLAPTGNAQYAENLVASLSLQIDKASSLRIELSDSGPSLREFHIVHSDGASMRGKSRWQTLGDFAVVGLNLGQQTQTIAVLSGERRAVVDAFTLSDVDIYIDVPARTVVITSADVTITRDWAAAIGRPHLAGFSVGSLTMRARLVPPVGTPALVTTSQETTTESATSTGSVAGVGPDIIVGDLHQIASYRPEGDIAAFAVGTVSCNVGTTNVNWVANTNKHPIIGQTMYRLKDGRFEQIGMSWVKHGFAALAGNACQLGCMAPPDTTQLGVGCSDPYSSSLNGSQDRLGPRFRINAFSGFYSYPISNPGYTGFSTTERRLQVHRADLDPLSNVGAVYFVEGQYVTADDALFGNGTNNNSYRPISFLQPPESCPFGGVAPGDYCAILSGTTQREKQAIYAWQDTDPMVEIVEMQVPDEGLFLLAGRATATTSGTWRYEYAIQNMNSDRSARAFVVPLPPGAFAQDIHFHDVDYHSGNEPYDLTDWVASRGPSSITWTTDSHAENSNANALRWGTLYSFGFESNTSPAPTDVTLHLFKPGLPSSLQATIVGPSLALVDCNGNQIADACDTDCSADGCAPPCGSFVDCNLNRVPDVCEPDCNGNGIADSCEIADCPAGELACADCNTNGLPDECDPDCDDNGIPDDCDTFEDCDGDGVVDCLDDCPCVNLPGQCTCPPLGCCFFPAIPDTCVGPDFPRDACIAQGGTPDCVEPLCRSGCLIGDGDLDGDVDIADHLMFQSCFSGPLGTPTFVPPSANCLTRFDLDSDNDVDRLDYGALNAFLTGP